MNKQRKILIIITYNEMGIIIDTKVEEVAQPNSISPVNPQEPKTDTWSIKGGADALERHGLLEQEPKTGHWIQTNEFFINQDGQFIYKFICSECKSLSYFRKSNKKAIGATVCPNCGAKMIEPQGSERTL